MDIPGLIRSLPGMVFFFFCAVPAAFVGIGIYVGWRSYRIAGLIARTRLTAAAAAQEGIAAIEGKASAPFGKPLKAPLTDSACCWFHCKVEEYVRRGSSGGSKWHWTTIAERTSEGPFLVSDGSGQCAVWPAGAEMLAPADRSVWHGATLKPQDRNPPRESPGKRPWFHGNVVVAGSPVLRFRYTEERIYPGDAIYALGWSSPEPPTGCEPLEDAAEDGEELGVEPAENDEDSDACLLGEEEAEWNREKARQLAPAHLAKPGRNHYLISTKSRAEVLKMHRLGAVGALLVGLIGALILAGVVAVRFG